MSLLQSSASQLAVSHLFLLCISWVVKASEFHASWPMAMWILGDCAIIASVRWQQSNGFVISVYIFSFEDSAFKCVCVHLCACECLCVHAHTFVNK